MTREIALLMIATAAVFGGVIATLIAAMPVTGTIYGVLMGVAFARIVQVEMAILRVDRAPRG